MKAVRFSDDHLSSKIMDWHCRITIKHASRKNFTQQPKWIMHATGKKNEKNQEFGIPKYCKQKWNPIIPERSDNTGLEKPSLKIFFFFLNFIRH